MTTSPKQKLSFKEAVKKVFVENYCNFKGRACRSELWWALLATTIGAIVFSNITTIGWLMKMQHLPEIRRLVNSQSADFFLPSADCETKK